MNTADQFEVAQHTPGPWHLIKKDLAFNIMARGQNIYGRICTVSWAWPHKQQVVEQKNNARLIAAAPDLLDALIDASNGLRWYQESFPEASNGCDEEAMSKIAAAIAKATGAPT
ncbi:hypothetical protein [Undibacterium sp. TJN19]|uniref:hypothetical protein n=1 Tax=Undibacterium sp. TJN19 TaxID=3413055 RepID=UPI003BF210C3